MKILALLSMHGTPNGEVSRHDGLEFHLRRITNDLVHEDATNGSRGFRVDRGALGRIAQSIDSEFDAVFCEALEGTAVDRIRKAEGLPDMSWIFWDSDGGARVIRFTAWFAAASGGTPVLSDGTTARMQWIYTTPRHRYDLMRAGLRREELTYVRSSTWILNLFFPNYGDLFNRTPSDSVTRREWQGRILAVGSADRDFWTLAEAAAGIPEPIHVLCPSGRVTNDYAPLRMHPYLPFDQFVEALSVCRFVIVPIQPTSASSGQTTLTMAMRMRKAVVTTETDGTRSYVQNGRTGWRVSAGDSVALRNSILDLLDHPDRRVSMEANAYAFESRMRDQSRRAFKSVLRRLQEGRA